MPPLPRPAGSCAALIAGLGRWALPALALAAGFAARAEGPGNGAGGGTAGASVERPDGPGRVEAIAPGLLPTTLPDLECAFDIRVIDTWGQKGERGVLAFTRQAFERHPRPWIEAAYAEWTLRGLERAGDADALCSLGFYRYWGKLESAGLAANPALAFYYSKRAADGGSPEGARNLALCYRDGIGTPADYALAAKYLRIAGLECALPWSESMRLMRSCLAFVDDR